MADDAHERVSAGKEADLSSPLGWSSAAASSGCTIEQCIDEIGIGRAQWVLLLITGLTFCSDAAEVAFLSFVTEQLRCEWNLTSQQETFISQAVFLGMIFGAPVWGYIADSVGRRPSFLVSSLVICTFGLATATAQGFYSLVVYRAVVGFGVAGLPVGFDILAEALPSAGRGAFLLYIEYFWTLGSIYVSVCAWLVLETLGWQVLTILAALPTLAASIGGYLALPESPRWLVEEGRDSEALVILNQWSAQNSNGAVFKAIRREHEHVHDAGSHSNCKGMVQLFSSRKLRRSTLLMIIVWFGYGIAYYGIVSLLPRIFQEESVASATPAPTVVPTPVAEAAAVAAAAASSAAAAISGPEAGPLAPAGAGVCEVTFAFRDIAVSAFSEVLGVIFAVFLIDSAGRRWTQLLFYTLGAAMSLTLGFRSIDLNVLTIAASVARLAEMAGSCATWVHTPELFPTSVRAEAHSMLNVMSKAGAVVGQFLISDGFSQVTCGVTMATISLCAGVAAMFCPETSGGELKDMPSEEENSSSEDESDRS